MMKIFLHNPHEFLKLPNHCPCNYSYKVNYNFSKELQPVINFHKTKASLTLPTKKFRKNFRSFIFIFFKFLSFFHIIKRLFLITLKLNKYPWMKMLLHRLFKYQKSFHPHNNSQKKKSNSLCASFDVIQQLEKKEKEGRRKVCNLYRTKKSRKKYTKEGKNYFHLLKKEFYVNLEHKCV